MAKRVVEQSLTLKLAAASFNVSAKTAAKWVRRYREAELADLSSRLRRCPRATSPPLQEKVLTLRWLHHNSGRIVLAHGMRGVSVSRILASGQDNRLRSLDPPPSG